MVQIGKQRSFRHRDGWRDWLSTHHDTEDELWVVFYKKDSGVLGMSYDEAVEEALCFGWIDGILKKIDDERYANRFTPRRCGSIWSETNKQRVAKMIEQKRMTAIGMAKVAEAKANGEWARAAQREQMGEIPLELKQAFKMDPVVKRKFESLSMSQKRLFVFFVTEAKREETRKRRAEVAAQMLKEGKKIDINTRMTPTRTVKTK
jgi:uncharacterized protein YdeI (YjbR/CyaY-like superfamily)